MCFKISKQRRAVLKYSLPLLIVTILLILCCTHTYAVLQTNRFQLTNSAITNRSFYGLFEFVTTRFYCTNKLGRATNWSV